MLQKVVSMNDNVPIDRIRKNIGGYLFVESDSNSDPLRDRLIRCCEPHGIRFVTSRETNDYENRLSFIGDGISGELGFAEQEGYRLVSVMFQKSSLRDLDATGIQLVKTLWIALCEASQCQFGYFSHYPEQTTESYRSKLLEDVVTYSAGDLMDNGFWMSYFNKDFLPLGSSVSVLPSGSWTFGGLENPVTGDVI